MKTLQSVTLVDQAVREIYIYIQKSELHAGEILPAESKLAAMLGVSRPVVREALRTLQGKGIVDMVNGKGAIVRPVDGRILVDYFNRVTDIGIDNAYQLEESRHGLEMHSAMLAAERATEQDLDEIEGILNEMRTAIHDKHRYAKLNTAFHNRIAKASGNPVLQQMISALHDSLSQVLKPVYDELVSDDHWAVIHNYHETIFKNLKERKSEEAGLTTLEHLRSSMKTL